jgi:ubiquinone/menaquinone biosynthesis C-methylase UbiE
MESEKFRPIALIAPDGLIGKLKFFARLALDLQVATVYESIQEKARSATGIMLDVGCGASPYRFLFSPEKIKYVGIDIIDADKFDYINSEIIHFNGETIPFSDAYFDMVLCTEVLEHVQDYQSLIKEIYRVMRPGAKLLVTVPWSARYHYIPFDFFRFTPSSLQHMFNNFQHVEIAPRGTDVTSIIAKMLVIWFRNIFQTRKNLNLFTLFLAAACTPIVPIIAGCGHLSVRWKIGSQEDPLGYTIFAVK